MNTTTRIPRTLVAAVLLGVLLGLPVAAQNAAGLQQNLDKSLNVTITDQPIRDVFDRLQRESGVKFAIDADTFERLPWGEQTRLRISLKNITLRNALSPMLAPQSLQWTVDGGAVRVSPNEALFRMGRRASYEELQLLAKLNSGKLDAAADKKAVLENLRKLTETPDLDLTVSRSEKQVEAAYARGLAALPCSPAAFLDAMCGTEYSWYLNDQTVVILPKKEQIERQLQQTVTLRYQSEKLSTVLLDLARKARVPLSIEPGVMQLLPSETRSNFSLVMADASIAQALEVISGSTGLKFTATDVGLSVEAGKPSGAANAAAQPRSPWMLQMDLDLNGETVRVTVRAEELPADLRDAIEAHKNAYIESLRKRLGTDGGDRIDNVTIVPDDEEGGH
ncbi:MAG: hypothetical protein FWE88_05520 [Phycisphaerae bacterium]|nr:hypothetical protein [Phycisphaerae bacterium]